MSTTLYFGFATGDQTSESAGPMKLKKRFAGIAAAAQPAKQTPIEEREDVKASALRAAGMSVWNNSATPSPRSDLRPATSSRARSQSRLREETDKWLFIFLTLCAAIIILSLG